METQTNLPIQARTLEEKFVMPMTVTLGNEIKQLTVRDIPSPPGGRSARVKAGSRDFNSLLPSSFPWTTE